MKILFIMRHPGHMRYYYATLKSLAQRGHSIEVTFDSPHKQDYFGFADRLAEEFPQVTIGNKTPKDKDKWQGLACALAWGMDYLRFLAPMYRNAPRLRFRVEVRIHAAFRRLMTKVPLISSPLGIRFVSWCLDKAYRAIPVSKKYRGFIRQRRPDIVLVTPLVTVGCEQPGYLMAAKSLRIRTACLVVSWDNLSSKGLIRGDPDRVILWNEVQKREAVELHGIDPRKIIMTGAQNFDEWFERKPTTSREEFCRRVGLRTDKPFILYMCSSNFTAPNEIPFVTQWMREIRGCNDETLRDIGILIRPYPEHADPWMDVDLTQYENVVIWPRERFAYPITEDFKAYFFDSIYHSSVVVGVNTSALIETAIIGKPVLTISAPKLEMGHEGTIHFDYILKENGGFVQVASNYEEHLCQLKDAVADNEKDRAAIREFVGRFVRPLGISKPATPLLVQAIEEIGQMRRAPKQVDPLSVRLLRKALHPVARYVDRVGKSEEWKRNVDEWKKASGRAAQLGLDPLLVWKSLQDPDGMPERAEGGSARSQGGRQEIGEKDTGAKF